MTHSLIAGAIDFIVFIHQNTLSAGARTVGDVVEVTGFDGARVSSSTIYAPSPVSGRAERTDTALTDARRKRLADAGYDDLGWFGGL